jgi:hypothetical protein
MPRSRSTIPRPAAARPAKGISRSGTRVSEITGTTDGVPATSADAAGSVRPDHVEAAAVRVDKEEEEEEEEEESRYRAPLSHR